MRLGKVHQAALPPLQHQDVTGTIYFFFSPQGGGFPGCCPEPWTSSRCCCFTHSLQALAEGQGLNPPLHSPWLRLPAKTLRK